MGRIKWIISSLFLLVAGILLIYMNPESLKKRNIMGFYTEEFQGIVIDKFVNVANNSYKQIVIQNIDDSETMVVSTPRNNEDIFSLVSIDDTIVKKKNTLKIILSNNSKREVLEIECCNFFSFYSRKNYPKCYTSEELSYYLGDKLSYYFKER